MWAHDGISYGKLLKMSPRQAVLGQELFEKYMHALWSFSGNSANFVQTVSDSRDDSHSFLEVTPLL